MNNTTTTTLLTTRGSNTPATRSEEWEENSGRNTNNNTSSTIPSNIQHDTTQVPNNYSRESTLLKNNSRSSCTAQEISSSVQRSFSETINTDNIAGISERASVSPFESKPTIASSTMEPFKNPYHTPLLGTQSIIEPCVPLRKLPNLTINVNNTSGLPPFNPAVLPPAGSQFFAKPNQISPPPPSNFPTIPTPPANFTTTTTLSSGTCTSVLGNSNYGSMPFSFSKPTSSFAELGEIISQGNFGMNNSNSSTYCNDTISCASTTSSTAADEPKKVKNRKEKSLTMICTKFIQYYEEKANSPTPSQSKGDIKIEEAVNTLGIEKRRIYDILNVLESISIVTKVGVSCYKFNGTKCLHSTLEQMKNNAYVDPLLFEGIQSLSKTPQNEPILKSLSKFKQASMTHSSRSNTLTSLSRLLIMCFLATEVREISQDQLLAIVLKDSTEKTRTRRLNDIVNILSAIHLLEKKTEKSVNVFKWLGGSLVSETKPSNSILSPSKMPLKKRKRVKTGSQGSDNETSPTAELGNAFSIVDTPQSESSLSTGEISEVSPISIPSASPSFLPGGSTTCKTPTSSGSNSSGGLHFQFRSPPSKKNKTIPLSSFTTVLGGSKISPKNLNEIFKNSEQPVANPIPTQSPSTPSAGITTTFGKLGLGSIFSQTTVQPSPRVMSSNIKAPLFNENNKENVSVKPPVSQVAKKLPANDSPTQQPGKITFKIRGANETCPRQPLGLKTDNGVNNQQNIKAPRP